MFLAAARPHLLRNFCGDDNTTLSSLPFGKVGGRGSWDVLDEQSED